MRARSVTMCQLVCSRGELRDVGLHSVVRELQLDSGVTFAAGCRGLHADRARVRDKAPVKGVDAPRSPVVRDRFRVHLIVTALEEVAGLVEAVTEDIVVIEDEVTVMEQIDRNGRVVDR